MKTPRIEARNVLITGCSSGIGAVAARILRDRGWQVIPTVRKPEDLDRLRQDGFDPVELDLADSDSVQQCAGRVLERVDRRLGALVNNAGFAQPGAMEDITREALRRQFEVNVFGLQELTNCFVPGFRQQGYGRIVNISSIFGLISVPFVGSYCASKYALEALSDSLRVEMRSSGVSVSLIEPGAIVTEFRRNAAAAGEMLDIAGSRFTDSYTREIERRKKQEKKPDLFTRPPEDVATKILHALESKHPKARYRVTIPAHAMAFLKRVLPTSVFDRLMAARLPK